ncbi:GUN4 domain-containing protein [Rivularia sp. UHCC 0363]|uniref:GUN4 domain-containing protein n=1 Tax=Rivularia sp. UHCC 0363 TaxID=3110244 RepID=UPI002B1F50D9|nr:GUN4 domain-containing protein [Rivularia sp. UHCC 0363]MEA5598965.1 GUN4 domain-containing protein [Rivularia sp. UHCC 0363]
MVNKIAQALKKIYFFVMQLSTTQKAYFAFVCVILGRFFIPPILKNISKYFTKYFNQIITVTSGILLFGLGCYLYISRLRKKEKQLNDDSIDNEKLTQDTNIYTNGGNYNESIEGDYIQIQGNYININQDSSEVAAEIRELINHLKNQGLTQEDAETQVADELAEQARQKRKFRNQLFKLRKSLSRGNQNTNKTNNEAEVAKEVVQSATSYRYTSSNHFTEVTEGNYQKLDALLQAKKWKEADLETAKIIYAKSNELLPDDYTYFPWDYQYVNRGCIVSAHIKVITRRELVTINKLWVKHSKGRFGFSVQKRIWEKLGGGSDTSHTYYEVQNKFGDAVGWRKGDEWLYYVDLYNSTRVKPPGHFPFALMLRSGEMERCQFDFSILEIIVGRMRQF